VILDSSIQTTTRSNSELEKVFCALPEIEFGEFCTLLSWGTIDTMCSDEDIWWETETKTATADDAGLTPSESNGCAPMQRWHGDYKINSIGGIGTTVDISGDPEKDGQSQYSTIKFTRGYRNSPMAKKIKEALGLATDPRLVDSDDDEVVTRTNSEFEKIFCAHPEIDFDDFCSHFSWGAIDTMCSDEDIWWETAEK